MRFRLPDECAGVVHAGISLAPDADRTIEAEESAANALAAHDILPVEVAEVAEVVEAAMPAPDVASRKSSRARADDRRMLR